jgi:dethiobiotin synthetase
MQNRQKGVFITGTDTDVGKTWLGEQLISHLVQKNIDVVPKKPIESGFSTSVEQSDSGKLTLAAGKSIQTQLETTCLYRFKPAISPVRAARLVNQRVKLEQLKKHCFENINNDQFLHVEGAGGFYSPLAEDGLNADLAEKLALPIIIVAEDRLGCISQILLTIEAATHRKLNILAVFLNQTQLIDQKINNLVDLKEYTKIPIILNVKELVQIVINYKNQ